MTTWRITRSSTDNQNRLIQLEEVKKIIALLKQDHDEIRNARGAEISVVASSSRVLEIASSLNIAVPNLDPLFTEYCLTRKELLKTRNNDLRDISPEEIVQAFDSLTVLSDQLAKTLDDLLNRIYRHARKLIGVREPKEVPSTETAERQR